MHQRNENEVETFTLQMTDIVMIEKGSYTSFTFAVLKDNDDGKMENVTVNYYTNGDIKAYLVVYDINDYEKELLRQGITISLDEKTKTFLLENLVDNESEQNEIVARLRDVKMCTQWVTQNTICKGELKHDITNFFECEYFQNGTWTPVVTTLEFVPCPDGGGGSGGGDGGYIPPGDDYPVGGGPDNDDPAEEDEFEGQITWPVIPKHHFKNCEKLAEMIANTGIRNSLNNLKNYVAQATREYGYGFSLDPNNPIIVAQLANNSETNIIMPYGGQIYGFSHIHPFETSQSLGDKRTMPMFSLTDIFGLAAIIQTHSDQNVDPSLFFLSLTVKNSSSSETYVLKIENKLQFMIAFANYRSLSKDEKITKGNNLSRLYEDRLKSGGGYSGYLKDMLTFMKNENINGLGVYQANDTNFSGWKKIILDSTGNNIGTIDCD